MERWGEGRGDREKGEKREEGEERQKREEGVEEGDKGRRERRCGMKKMEKRRSNSRLWRGEALAKGEGGSVLLKRGNC